MRHIRVTDPRAHQIIEAILARDAGMPVRALEELLTRGDAGLGMLMVAARLSVETHRRPGYAHWSAVGLGEMGDSDAAPALALLLRLAWRAQAIDLGFSAAEAMGKLGAAAEEDLLRYAELAQRSERYWFHYAAACMATERAADWLLGELDRNVALADSAAVALALLGRKDALPAIDRALPRIKPHQLPLMSEAVISLHSGRPLLGTDTPDWRLRYRYRPGLGRFPSLLPCLAAMLRSHPSGRAAVANSGSKVPRSVATIIEQAEGGRPAEPMRSGEVPRQPGSRCEACGRDALHCRTGLTLCGECARDVARIHADDLLSVRSDSDDLFTVLNLVDNNIMKHDMKGLSETGDYARWVRVQESCHWLIGQGIETVAAGAATLLTETNVRYDAPADME